MSGVKHTPGPWEVAYFDRSDQAVVSGAHTEVCTCWHHSVGSLEKQMRANARLIAAAPDLLEAARLFVAYDESDEADAATPDMMASYFLALEAARAAILKATGDAR